MATYQLFEYHMEALRYRPNTTRLLRRGVQGPAVRTPGTAALSLLELRRGQNQEAAHVLAVHSSEPTAWAQ